VSRSEVGHDVVVIAEVVKGAADEQVLERPLSEKRVLISEGRDFSELVYARRRSSAGVILVRVHSRVAQARDRGRGGDQPGRRLRDAFTVIEVGRVRISSRP